MSTYGSLSPVGYSNPVSDKVGQILKGTKLGEFENKKEQESEKYRVFDEVSCLSHAACKMYVDGDLTFDEAVSELAKAILKFKGKEGELIKAARKGDDARDSD